MRPPGRRRPSRHPPRRPRPPRRSPAHRPRRPPRAPRWPWRRSRRTVARSSRQRTTAGSSATLR
ncbi:MAG: hypothetical protein DI639_12450 [Leifsonia xyli]|nr:MAG: hypothetical protein DI639_12450 [Leifsonia xyli]